MAKRHTPVRSMSRKMGHTIAGFRDPTSFPKVKISHGKVKLANNSLNVMMQQLYILRIEEQGINSIGGVALEDNIFIAMFNQPTVLIQLSRTPHSGPNGSQWLHLKVIQPTGGESHSLSWLVEPDCAFRSSSSLVLMLITVTGKGVVFFSWMRAFLALQIH
uniref:Uncharacterized protein n=1 Tax=Cannabis sativa TaxID=3483 RepID=A0A803NVN9_CANSA